MGKAESAFLWNFNYLHPCVFTSNEINDSFTLSQMLEQDDIADFVEAMIKEIEDHEDNELCGVINKNAIPPESKTVLDDIQMLDL